MKIIGIHKGAGLKNYNLGTLLKEPIEKFNEGIKRNRIDNSENKHNYIQENENSININKNEENEQKEKVNNNDRKKEY